MQRFLTLKSLSLMAKQSGLHQLRGKVGEHSYYRQTGVATGLVRSINQGMSQRVKTGEEYANVRLNNAEFGQGGRIASVLAQYISPKFRPMVLPFSQSKMAKIILEYIKMDSTAPWGQRNITQSNSVEVQVAALNSVVKNRFEDFGLKLTIDEENTQLTMEATNETVSKLSDIGADGFSYRFLATSTCIGNFVSALGKYAPSYSRASVYAESFDDPQSGDDATFTYSLPSGPLPPGTFAAGRTGVLIILPYRLINDTQYTLQEHCTFKAFEIVDGPVN